MWVLMSLISAFFQVGLSESNRRFQLPADKLNLFRAFFAAAIFFPFAIIAEWPTNHWFYAVAIFNGVIGGLAMRMFLKISATHNGRVANLYKPLRIFIMFTLWVLIDAGHRQGFINDPAHFSLVVLCILLGSAAILGLRRNALGWEGFLLSIPIAIMFGLADIAVKLVIPMGQVTQYIPIYMLITFSFTFIMELATCIKKKELKVTISNKNIAKKGFITACFSAGAFSFATAGYVLAPKPAYSSVVTLIVPVMLLVYHKLFKIKDDASPIAGTILVLAAVGLVLVTME